MSLALSRRLVELHGGRLRVEQYEDSTLFEFILPIGELTADSMASLGTTRNRGRRASETQDQPTFTSPEVPSELDRADEPTRLRAIVAAGRKSAL